MSFSAIRDIISAFNIDGNEAASMAELTMGYPYAYQLLGYLCWTRKTSWINITEDFDAYLEDYVYEKIWSECSAQDRKVLGAIADTPSSKVEDIRGIIDMSSNTFTVYRKRLLKKGLVKSTGQGYLELTLPRFDVFVRNSQ